jgi:hypothetical protein
MVAPTPESSGWRVARVSDMWIINVEHLLSDLRNEWLSNCIPGGNTIPVGLDFPFDATRVVLSALLQVEIASWFLTG